MVGDDDERSVAHQEIESARNVDLDAVNRTHVAGEPLLKRHAFGVGIEAAVLQLLEAAQGRSNVGGETCGVSPPAGGSCDRARGFDGTAKQGAGLSRLNRLLLGEHGACSMGAPCRGSVTPW